MNPLSDKLDHSRLVDGEPCYRCGKVITARLSHMCKEQKRLSGDGDAKSHHPLARSIWRTLMAWPDSNSVGIAFNHDEWEQIIKVLNASATRFRVTTFGCDDDGLVSAVVYDEEREQSVAVERIVSATALEMGRLTTELRAVERHLNAAGVRRVSPEQATSDRVYDLLHNPDARHTPPEEERKIKNGERAAVLLIVNGVPTVLQPGEELPNG